MGHGLRLLKGRRDERERQSKHLLSTSTKQGVLRMLIGKAASSCVPFTLLHAAVRCSEKDQGRVFRRHQAHFTTAVGLVCVTSRESRLG